MTRMIKPRLLEDLKRRWVDQKIKAPKFSAGLASLPISQKQIRSTA